MLTALDPLSPARGAVIFGRAFMATQLMPVDVAVIGLGVGGAGVLRLSGDGATGQELETERCVTRKRVDLGYEQTSG